MRLLFVTHSFPPPDRPLENIGGMQRVASELHTALLRVQHGADDGSSALSYRVHALVSTWKWIHWRIAPFLVRTLFRVRRDIRRQDVDVILFSSMVTALLVLLLRRADWRSHPDRGSSRTRLAAIVHGQDVTKPVGIYQKLVRRAFSRLDLVLPVSAATGDACLERGLLPRQLHVVHNGVDTKRFDPVLEELSRQPTAISRAWAEIDPSAVPQAAADTAAAAVPQAADTAAEQAAPLLLCSLGRHVKRKGFAWFIREVMPRLPEEVHYWLGGDGPESEAIERAIAETGLARRVRLVGRLDEEELVDLYRTAHLFVMPNIPVAGDMEGFGIVMLEAGLVGLPTVAARLEGIREVISPGKNGYFVESGDAAGFAERIRVLAADRDHLAALSRSTREYVANTFSWERVANNYLEALSRISSR